jgi:hypothetical protein
MAKKIQSIIGLFLALWSTSTYAVMASYVEEFSSVMVSSDQAQIMFVGKQYSYVIKVPEPKRLALATALSTEFGKKLSWDHLGTFFIGPYGDMSSEITVKLDDDLTEADVKQADELGFQISRSGGREISYQLSGQRYKGEGPAEWSGEKVLLSSTYRVEVRDKRTTGKREPPNVLSYIAGSAIIAFVVSYPWTLLVLVPYVYSTKTD